MLNNREAICPESWRVPLLIGITAAAIPFLSDEARWVMIGSLVAVLAVFVVCLRPNRWLVLFFAIDFLTPPIGGDVGGAGVHLAIAAAFLGLMAGLLQIGEWRMRKGALPLLFAAFSVCLLLSLPFALLYSGTELAIRSALRIGLFLIGVYVFCYTIYAPAGDSRDPEKLSQLLFLVAAIAAAFACLDFYFQFPAPAGFSEQYVWLDSGVFRRAQGLFYDASTLGNFCAFFLLYGLIALLEPVRNHHKRIVIWTGVVVLGCALILSYSRASVVNVAIAMTAYAILRGGRNLRTSARIAAAVLVGGALAMTLVQLLMPSFAAGYFGRIAGSLEYFAERPDAVLSGRLTTWNALASLIAAHPWETVFGIGYKTLPYTTHFGDPLVADNTYLSLLVETGIAGLASFLLLLWAILKSTFRVARSASPRASFLGKWAFCFWCGQTVQMFSGDLLTYWRVLPVYFWIVAAALREQGHAR